MATHWMVDLDKRFPSKSASHAQELRGTRSYVGARNAISHHLNQQRGCCYGRKAVETPEVIATDPPPYSGLPI